MEEMSNKNLKKIITTVNVNPVQTITYKYKFKFKNFIKALFYSIIILGSLLNFYGVVIAIVGSMLWEKN